MNNSITNNTLSIILSTCFIIFMSSAASAQDSTDLARAYSAAVEQNQPMQNAVYLYLRLAGIFWIAVEWFAAIILVRLHNRLKLLERQHAP